MCLKKKVMNLYNEIDKDAAQWLRNLIDSTEIPLGYVEEKSITELNPSELKDYTQVHLFAGIGGWPLALKLAGWSENLPVWTGSCPCQPFSVAGKQKGNEDERHLWPEMYRLIKECKPPVIFGEQVASPDGIDWMQAVQADLEAAGYEVGKLDLCAAGIGSPQIRQRIFWVAYDKGFGRGEERPHERGCGTGTCKEGDDSGRFKSSRGVNYWVAISQCIRWGGWGEVDRKLGRLPKTETERHCPSGGVAHASREGLERHSGNVNDWNQPRRDDQNETGSAPKGGTDSNWNDIEWLLCRDNKIRPTQSGLFPLAHGLPRSLGNGSTRVDRMELLAAKRSRKIQLKGYGNAIVPQLAAMFIKSVMEWIETKEVEE